MLLHHKIYDSTGKQEVVVILHGLFGMLDNWHNIATALSKTRTVVTMDLRNHGKSDHSAEMSFALMAKDVLETIQFLNLSDVVLLGHSMGGKVAMTFADLFPTILKKIVIADISPRAYPAGHLVYFDAYKNIDWSQISDRSAADNALSAIEPNEGIRLFLLKNVERNGTDGFQLKINVDVIEKFYPKMIGALHFSSKIVLPTLFLTGEKSNYVTQKDKEYILEQFLQVRFAAVPNAGHWLHAENPKAFLDALLSFLEE